MFSNFFAPAFLTTLEKAPLEGIEFRRCQNVITLIEQIGEVDEKESETSFSNDHVPPLLDLASHYFNLTSRNEINFSFHNQLKERQPRLFTVHHAFLI